MTQNIGLSSFCSFKENSTTNEGSVKCSLFNNWMGGESAVFKCVKAVCEYVSGCIGIDCFTVWLIAFEPLLGWVEPNVLFPCEHKDKTNIDPLVLFMCKITKEMQRERLEEQDSVIWLLYLFLV